MGIFKWFKREKTTGDKQSDHLLEGLQLMKSDPDRCIEKVLLHIQNASDTLILQEIERLDNTFITNAGPELNSKLWVGIREQYRNDSRVTGMLNALWAKHVHDKNATALARWMEIYLKLDWNAGRNWCEQEECDQIISEYVKANPNNTDRMCALIFGLNGCGRISSMIFPLLMYITDIPNTPIADNVLSVVENTLCNGASSTEKAEIQQAIQQLLQAVRSEISTDYLVYARKAIDIFNANNPSDQLWRP